MTAKKTAQSLETGPRSTGFVRVIPPVVHDFDPLRLKALRAYNVESRKTFPVPELAPVENSTSAPADGAAITDLASKTEAA